MDQILSKYTLRFLEEKVEVQYQAQAIQNTLKPLYYLVLFLTLIMNIVQLILREIQLGRISFINVSFIILTIINLICLYKKKQLTQLSITLSNAYVLLLQINFIGSETTEQEYYAYGSVFALLQTWVYFVTDFHYSCPSIIIHVLFRFSVTTYYSQRFDILLFGLSLMGAALLIIVLYICNRAQRHQFFMQIKDETINQQLEILINKPFSKFKYDEEKLKIDIQMVKFPQLFIGFQKELCHGCNMRNYLRNCKFENITLEMGLLRGKIPLNGSFIVKINKQQITLRVCQFSVDKSLIIIQERVPNQNIKVNRVPQNMKKQLQSQVANLRKSLLNQLFLFGVMSVLTLNSFEIKTINLSKFFSKMQNIYSFLSQVKIKFRYNQTVKITTYYNLFKIFMIQVFSIISEGESESEYLEEIEFFQFDICVVMKLKLSKCKQFSLRYNQNFFIKQTSQKLLLQPLNEELEITFNSNISYLHNLQ